MPFRPVITKIRAPRPPQALLRRRDIPNPLNQERLPKLVWVAASAGYGKTSLVLDWLSSSDSGRFKTAWYSLETEDNDINQFTNHLIAAIQEVDTAFGAELQVLATTVLPIDYDSVFASLINGLAAIKSRLVIVLDDVHSIDSEDIHTRIDWLVRHLPDNVCLIGTSRSDPPFEVS
ncbi:MAG: AAA family ATPase, partial [Dehalococcoidia bacterium]